MADIRQQAPVTSQASASVKGVNGSALAALFLQEWEEKAREELKAQKSFKDQLKDLMKIAADKDAMGMFRQTLLARRTVIAKAADDAKAANLTEYLDEHPVEASLQVRISQWLTLSAAVDRGWTPDYKQYWGQILKDSVRAKNATASNGAGQPGGPAATAASNQTQSGRKPVSAVKKLEAFVKTNLIPEEGKPLPERNLAAMVELLCRTATFDEMKAVKATVDTIYAIKEKESQAAETADKAIKGAAAKPAPAGKKTAKKAEQAPASKETAPVAKSERRYSTGRKATI